MAISPVKIGNMALSNIGDSGTIESFNEDSAQAKEINIWYDFAREQVLEGLDWNFARKRQTLALHGDDPPDTWLYRYQYPADCIAIRSLENPAGLKADPVPFTFENSLDGNQKTILTNLESAKALYTFNLTSTLLFSPSFILAFSYLLGHYIAYPLTGKFAVKEKMLAMYKIVLREAQAFNAQEQMDDTPRDAPWISGR